VSVHVRRATPDDVALLAWVGLTASRSHLERGLWEYLNGHDEVQTLEFLRRIGTSDAVHLFHQSLFLVAELDGEPAAAMCGYDSATQGLDVFGPVMAEVTAGLGVDLADPDYGRRLGVMMSGFVTDHDGPPGPRWVIENVATKPEFRRRGLVDALLHQLLGHGRALGFEYAQIGVFLGNERARRAYLKAGFEVVAEARSADWERELGCAGSELLLQRL
jgi:translation initiation factor 4G